MKKGQMEMMETFMVLLVFLVLLAVGIFFYFRFSATGIEERGEEASILSGTTLLSAMTSMPELQCSKRGREENCLDAAKMTIAVEKNLFKSKEYKDLFGKKSIFVNASYPLQNPFNPNSNPLWKTRCSSMLSYSNGCGQWILLNYTLSSKSLISTPVSIYYPEKDTYVIGKLYIRG